jgi:hypothetical protein
MSLRRPDVQSRKTCDPHLGVILSLAGTNGEIGKGSLTGVRMKVLVAYNTQGYVFVAQHIPCKPPPKQQASGEQQTS